MQPSSNSKKYFHDNDYFDANEEGQRSFAEVVNNEEEENPDNIFTQGNMLLRNEESEFVQDEVGSLNDGDYKSGSHSEDEQTNKDKVFAGYSQITPTRQHNNSYGDLMMISPEMQQRHTPYMPVYSQEEEVEINQPALDNSNNVSANKSQVSEEDFYASQYAQTRLFPNDMYGFPQLSQTTQQDLHSLNYQQQQSFLHSRQYANDSYYYKDEDRSHSSNAYTQRKQTISQTQKQPTVRGPIASEYMCDTYKQGVFKKIRLPSDVNDDDENAVREYEETPHSKSESQLPKMNDENEQASHSIREVVRRDQSESFRVNSINQDDSKSIIERKVSTNSKASKPKTPKLKRKEPQAAKQEDSGSEEMIVTSRKDLLPQFRVVKGKRRNARERKYFEKQRKLIEQVYPNVKELGALEWESIVSKLSKLPAEQEPDKLNPYNSFNTSTFWYYISSMYFPKCYEVTLKERLCLLVNFLRGEGTQKHWEKNLRDHSTFLRKSYRLQTSAMNRLNRALIKQKDSSKKTFDKKKPQKDISPTEIEDLICQLEAEREDCTLAVDLMVAKLLESVKPKKRPKLDYSSEDGQLRQLINRNASCQQALHFYQELNNFGQRTTVEYLNMEEARYSQIKDQKLKLLREQYERQRMEGSKDYIQCEPIGKSFMGMTRYSYEACFICCSDEYDQSNIKLQCSVCEYFVHQDCLGESVQSATEQEVIDPVWTCQSCQVDQSLRKKFPGMDVSFKPDCCFCGLSGGLMRATTSVLPDIKKTPGCNNTSQYSVSSTNGITISNLTRKEKEYQVKLVDARIKSWQDQNEGKQLPKLSNDEDSLMTLPEIRDQFAPSFVYWVHMSCSQWLLQKALIKKRPVVLKRVPNQVHSNEAEKCEICGGSYGMMQQCTYTKVRSGEDKMLEQLYKNFVQDPTLDVSKDKVAGEFLDNLIEGGACDGIQHPSANTKNSKGCVVDLCQNKMHIECARRAELHMNYDVELDQVEFFCTHHTPLPLHLELKQSLDEQIKSITDFAESYQVILKESQQLLEWTEKETQDLLAMVAEAFYDLTKLGVPVQMADGRFAVEGSTEEPDVKLLPGNADWHVTLSYKEFPWQSISVGNHDSIDCWKKYWEVIGLHENRFRQQVMGQNKKHQLRYQKFVKLRQKVLSDAKEMQRAQKEHKKVEFEQEVSELDRPADQAEEQPKEEGLVQAEERVEDKPKKKTLRVTPPIEPRGIDRLRPRLERSAQMVSQQNSKPITPQPSAQPKSAPDAEKFKEPIFETKRESPEKTDKSEQEKSGIAAQRKLKQTEKMAEKIEKIEHKAIATMLLTSCYCKTKLTIDLNSNKVIKPQRLPDGTDPMPKFFSKENERKYHEAISAPHSRCSKSGFLRCANKSDCVLGGFFHVVCCYNEEVKFDLKRKSREKWFCLSCREKLAKEAKLAEAKEKEQSPVKQAEKAIAETMTKSPVKKLAKSPMKILENTNELENANEKRASKRLLKPKIEEALKPLVKRLKTEDSPVIKNAKLDILHVEPVGTKEKKTPIKEQPSIEETKRPVMAKEVPNQTSVPPLQGFPWIDTIIRTVEEVQSAQLDQQQQNVFMQLYQALQKYQGAINSVSQATTAVTPIKMEEPKVEKPSQPHQKVEQVSGEIEIKLGPAVAQKPVKSTSTPKQRPLVGTQPAKPEKSETTQISIEHKHEEKPEKKVDQSQFSLSQQFQVNLHQQRKHKPAIKEVAVQLPIESKPEDIIYVPIELKLEKTQSQSTSSKPQKSKKDKDHELKKSVSSPQSASQPVTIAYYANTKAGTRNEQTKSMQQHGSGSGSPPYQQNPLEPKLAAGPASGYPQQYNQVQQVPQQMAFIQPEMFDQMRMSEGQQFVPFMTEDDLAEMRRKEEKRERKRQRKEERRRLEQQNLINIETMQSSYVHETNPSVISICTDPMQSADANMIHLANAIEMPPIKMKKSKKAKKSKEAPIDIVVDTSMPASLVSINQPFNFVSPMIDHGSSISIPTLPPRPTQPFKAAAFSQPFQIPFSLPQQTFHSHADDDIVISIPMGQKHQQGNEIILTLNEGMKKLK